MIANLNDILAISPNFYFAQNNMSGTQSSLSTTEEEEEDEEEEEKLKNSRTKTLEAIIKEDESIVTAFGDYVSFLSRK